jgi:hypothetical protein
MRGYYAEELARGEDLGVFPELWKMPDVPGHKVVGAGSIGAFDKFVVLWIVCHLNSPHGIYDVYPLSKQVEELLPEALSNLELWS